MGTRAEAQVYLNGLLAREIPGLAIMEFRISRYQFSALKRYMVLDGTEAATQFLNKYSRMYGEGAAHGFEYIMSPTGNYGMQHYFSKEVFYLLKGKKL